MQHSITEVRLGLKRESIDAVKNYSELGRPEKQELGEVRGMCSR